MILRYRLLFLLLCATRLSYAQSEKDPTPTPEELRYHAISSDLFSLWLLHNPALYYEYRKNRWGGQTRVSYRPQSREQRLDEGSAPFGLPYHRAYQYRLFEAGVNYYVPRKHPRKNAANHLTLGFLLSHQRRQLKDACVYDGADVSQSYYEALDQSQRELNAAYLHVGYTLSNSFERRIGFLFEPFVGIGRGREVTITQGRRVGGFSRSSGLSRDDCYTMPENATVEPIDNKEVRYYFLPSFGLRLSLLLGRRIRY